MCTKYQTVELDEVSLQIGLLWWIEAVLGLGLLFPKYYLIFHSEFPKYYSLRVDPLFHKILLTVSQKWPKQTRQKYTLHKSYTEIHKDLNFKLTVDRSSNKVSRHGHSETESKSTELTIYISMADYSLADSVNFCLFPELFLFQVLPIILEIIREQ